MKTDTTLAGQAAVLTVATGVAGDGVRAFLDGTLLGLELLLALPDDTLRALAARFRANCTPREIGRCAAELDAWPEDIRVRSIGSAACLCTASPSMASGSTPDWMPSRTCASRCRPRSSSA